MKAIVVRKEQTTERKIARCVIFPSENNLLAIN